MIDTAISASPVIAIAGAGLITGLIRLGGVAFGHALAGHPVVRRFLNLVPGCLLAAMLAPPMIHGDPAFLIGAVITVIAARRLGNLLAVLAVGTISVAALRWVLAML